MQALTFMAFIQVLAVCLREAALMSCIAPKYRSSNKHLILKNNYENHSAVIIRKT
jgi:hypothetical protein